MRRRLMWAVVLCVALSLLLAGCHTPPMENDTPPSIFTQENNRL